MPRWAFFPVVHRIVLAIHLGLSFVFIVAPGERFSAPAWKPLLQWFDGSLVPFGFVIGVSGFLMVWNKRWSNLVGAGVGVCWMMILAANFLVALEDERASATGPIVYLGVAALNSALFTEELLELLRERRIRRQND